MDEGKITCKMELINSLFILYTSGSSKNLEKCMSGGKHQETKWAKKILDTIYRVFYDKIRISNLIMYGTQYY